MNHTDVLIKLVELLKPKAYLEIGVQNARTFDRIDAEIKVGVDPGEQGQSIHPSVTHPVTSDEFFRKNRRKFDLIFIDGDHRAKQVQKDLDNALKYLRDGGAIVIHDVYPRNEQMQKVPRKTRQWTGDGWKVWAKFCGAGNTAVTLRDDFGVGVYHRSLPSLSGFVPENLDWEWFNDHKFLGMNTVGPAQLFEYIESNEQ